MKQAPSANRILLVLTLFFVLLAAVSFAAFRQPDTTCAPTAECLRNEAPLKRGGSQMLWDAFSQRVLSLSFF